MYVENYPLQVIARLLETMARGVAMEDADQSEARTCCLRHILGNLLCDCFTVVIGVPAVATNPPYPSRTVA